MIKIDIISGFLGAGKTTLIKKLLMSTLKNEKVCLIENEFGEIGIDGSLLKDSGIKIKEINSGCICCSLIGDFSSSMKEVITTYQPERIIIEPSGVGKLSDILKAIDKIDEDLKVNIIACVVDGKKAKIQIKNFGEFLKDQIEFAKSIIISKIDLVEENKLQECVDLIRTINSNANVITTKLDEISDQQLLEVLESNGSLKDLMIENIKGEHHNHNEECCHHHHDEECHCHHHHHGSCNEENVHEDCSCRNHHDSSKHDHHADEVFTSWGMETVYSISKDNLILFLESLKNDEFGMALRSKGILKAKDNNMWYYFDFVSGEYSIKEGNPDYTGRIVVIGSKLNTNQINDKFLELVK